MPEQMIPKTIAYVDALPRQVWEKRKLFTIFFFGYNRHFYAEDNRS
jgi:hypothetical protein